MRVECSAIKLGMEIRGQPFRCDGALMDYVRSLAKRPKKQRKLQQIQVNGQSYYGSYYANVSK